MSAIQQSALVWKEYFRRAALWGIYLGARSASNWFPAIAAKLAALIWFSPIRPKSALKELLSSIPPETWSLRSGSHAIKIFRFKKPESVSNGTVILVHGWAGSMKQFEKMIAHLLETGKTVVTFDFPSHGRSPGFTTDLLDMEETLDAVLKDCEGPLDLICHSFGLIVASRVASKGSVKFRKIVSISSPFTFGFLVDQFLSKTKLHQKIRPDLIRSIQRRVEGQIDVEKQIDVKSGLIEEENWLVIHDEDDREVPFASFHELRERFPRTSTFTTKGLGHNRILAAQSVFDSISNFLGKSAI